MFVAVERRIHLPPIFTKAAFDLQKILLKLHTPKNGIGLAVK